MAEADTSAPPVADVIAWPLVHKLERPVSVFGQDYAEITLREPTVADLLKFRVLDDGLDGDQLVEMIAHLSGLTPQTFKMFPGVEVLRLSRVLTRFFSQAAR